MKSENLAIGYGAVIQTILKLSPDEKTANEKLYEIGKQMGIRMSDEYNNRQCSYLSPSELIKASLIKIVKNTFGLTIELVQQSIRFEKRNHFYNLAYRQLGTSKTVLSLCQDIQDRFKTLQPGKIVAGFIYGFLESMNFYGEVSTQRQQNSAQKLRYVVSVKKDIKQED